MVERSEVVVRKKGRGRHGCRQLRVVNAAAHRHAHSAGRYRQLSLDVHDELITDGFCGAGGASEGIYLALGRHVDIAINHNETAISLHAANHPSAIHLKEHIFDVDPIAATKGRRVGLAWWSPDCRHFSRAKGGKPLSKGIRSLAWVIVKWAGKVAPRLIAIENVPELQKWGGLIAKRDPITGRVLRKDGSVAEPGQRTPLDQQVLVPDPAKKGRNFRALIAALKSLGYEVEYRELSACDYGAPTTRKRLFLIARNDGQPIVWPKPSHGSPDNLHVRAGKLKPWRTAAECLDFSLPCPSIFLSKEEGRALGVRRPLASATIKRVGSAVVRYIMKSKTPFVVSENGRVVQGLSMATVGYGERAGQRPRSLDVMAPLGTVVAGGTKHAVVCATMVKHFGGVIGFPLNSEPMHTITGTDHHALAMVELRRIEASAVIKLRGTNIGHPMNEPLHTVSAQGNHFAEVRALLVECGAEGVEGDPTLMEWNGHTYRIVDIGMRMVKAKELFLASGFDEAYGIGDDPSRGPLLTAEQQVQMVGNSVPPPLVAAIVGANCPELAIRKAA